MTGHLGAHAFLGDRHTVALVSDSGALDWLRLPRFDSPTCFSALPGTEPAGVWLAGPAGGGRATRRRYRPDTLVLESEWDTPQGTVRLIDCMPPRSDVARVVRVVEGVTGNVPVRVLFAPVFDDGRRSPWIRCSGRTVSAVAGADALWLDGDVPFERTDAEGAAQARFTVSSGQRVGFVLTHAPSHLAKPVAPDGVTAIDVTERFWSTWLAGIDSAGPWESAVRRALITVKALTHAPTGAVVTAPAFAPGRHRHCCELHGAASTLRALLDAGLADEARAWREWLVRAVAGSPRELCGRYTVDGTGDPAAGSGPRALGEVLYALNLSDDPWLRSRDPAWDLQLGLLDHLESTWDRPDTGRADTGASPRHLVHPKVMAWAGVDRAVRTAERHGLPGPLDDWRLLRSRIRAEVCAKGYDPDRNTFESHYGSGIADPSLLAIPEVGFLPWRDVRVRGTVAAVAAALGEESPAGLTSGTALSAGFRLAAAYGGTGNTSAARTLFDLLLGTRDDVGLFGEHYAPGGHRIGPVPHPAATISMLDAAGRLRPHVDDPSRRGVPA